MITAKFIDSVLARYEILCSQLTALLWRLRGARIGKHLAIRGTVRLVGRPRNLMIGDDVSINDGVVIELRDTVSIGSRTHISSGAKLHTGYLVRDDDGHLFHKSGPIVVGHDVWIATEAVISADVTIGSCVTIGANSVVLQDIAECGNYAGSPARRLRGSRLHE